MKQPNPYIMQGAENWWLSVDVLLVQVAQGDERFGVTMGTDPQKFLTEVTQALEAGTNGIQGVAGGENFKSNTTEDSEVITVAPQTKRGSRNRSHVTTLRSRASTTRDSVRTRRT